MTASTLLEQPSIEELLTLLSDSIELAAANAHSEERADYDEVEAMLGAMLTDVPGYLFELFGPWK